MNTLANQRMLKARISKGWSQDTGQMMFSRVHNSTAPFKSDKNRPDWVEGVIWGGAFLGLAVFLFWAMGFIV